MNSNNHILPDQYVMSCRPMRLLLTFAFIVIGLVLFSQCAWASVLSVTPGQKEFALHETFLAEVHLNSEGEVINAVQASINYPADLLEVVSVSNGGSFLTLWPEEPAFDSSVGLISLAGGIPNGSYVMDGKVATITFKTKSPGVAEVDFDLLDTSVHLNDGRGTAASLEVAPGIFTIGSTPWVNIFSPTHPDENTWYKGNTFTAEWSVKENASYSYMLSSRPDEKPDYKDRSESGAVTYFDLADGVYYLILSEKSADQSWEVVGRRRAMIDSRPPLSIEATISREDTLYDGQYFLMFSTVDKGSGIDHYDVLEGDDLSNDVSSPYILKDQTRSSKIVIRAYDRAGNKTEYTISNEQQSSKTPVNSSVIIVLAILILGVVVLLLLWFVFKMRQKK